MGYSGPKYNAPQKPIEWGPPEKATVYERKPMDVVGKPIGETERLRERLQEWDHHKALADKPSFRGTIAQVLEMHDRKNQDYGTDADPFANVRQSEQFGVPAWLGAIIRLNDKITRIKAYTRNGNLANESLRDSLIDIVVYGAIAVTLFDQAQAEAEPSTFCP